MNRGISRIIILFFTVIFTTQFLFTSHLLAEDDKKDDNQTEMKEENLPLTFTGNDWYQSSVNFSIESLNNTKIPYDAKGVYLTGNTAGNTTKYQHFVNLLNETELNALVIDIKEDSGFVTYRSNAGLVKEVRSDRQTFIKDLDELIQIAKENNIYTIARIVTFKDPFFAGAKPKYAMQRKTGGVWRDKYGVSWVDPYRKEVWEYNISIAKEVAEKGFDEIQFDYVRFPENPKKVDREVAYVNPENMTKAEAIAKFLNYARTELKNYPVYISADVFGLTTTTVDDMGIGQQWELIASVVDYVSPMMYPSHYANRSYGISIPDANPYATIKAGIEDGIEKNDKLVEQDKTVAVIRPWYQDFTASWVKGHIKYGPEEVLDQVRAGKELGINQYLLWNSGNKYSEEAWTNQ